MSVYLADHDVTLHHGHVLDVLPTLAAESVNCVVTSPPYYNLRDYGVDGQIGLEPSPAEYVETMRGVFAEVRRVLTKDGVLWLNLGDSYSRGPGEHTDGPQQSRNGSGVRGPRLMHPSASRACLTRTFSDVPPAKNLLGIPWRVAFALQDDGWVLRNAVVWAKPNAMPESVTDRLSTRYEHVFLFSRSPRYWFDLDPVREPHITADRVLIKAPRGSQAWSANASIGQPQQASGTAGVGRDENGRNPGDVWTIATQPFPGAHFATFPPDLAKRCILAGCPKDGVVLDPFTGSGTTLMVARQLARKAVGIELNPAYLDIAAKRIGQEPLDFGTAS